MEVATFDRWLSDIAESSTDPIVSGSEEMVQHCLDLNDNIPNEYSWVFSPKESIEKQLIDTHSSCDANKVFWEDQARNLEAYSMMTLWRGLELISSCVCGLNNKEVISPAISARALLELATVYILNANVLHKTFRDLIFPKDTVVVSKEVEGLIVKMIWGTRYDNPDPHVQQINILTSLKRAAKHPSNYQLEGNYEYLCDIAHPSFIGNTSYWSHVDSVEFDGKENRIISRLPTRRFNSEIYEKTLWALGWSSTCIRNSYRMMSEANEILIGKLQIN